MELTVVSSQPENVFDKCREFGYYAVDKRGLHHFRATFLNQLNASHFYRRSAINTFLELHKSHLSMSIILKRWKYASKKYYLVKILKTSHRKCSGMSGTQYLRKLLHSTCRPQPSEKIISSENKTNLLQMNICCIKSSQQIFLKNINFFSQESQLFCCWGIPPVRRNPLKIVCGEFSDCDAVLNARGDRELSCWRNTEDPILGTRKNRSFIKIFSMNLYLL